MSGVEGVETVLEQLGLAVGQVDEDGVLLIDLVDFDVGAAVLELDLGVGQIVGDHLDGAVVAETEKDAGRQQNLGFAVGGGDHLSGLHLGVADSALDERGRPSIEACPST